MKHTSNRLKRKIRMSLQQKTLVMLIILLLFFCTMFMMATFIIIKKAEDDFKLRTSETAVNNVASTVSNSLVTYNYITRLIMLNDDVMSFLRVNEATNSKNYDARMGIYETCSLYSYIDSIFLFRNDGVFLTSGQGKYVVDRDKLDCSKILDAHGSSVVSINSNGAIEKEGIDTMLTMSRAIYDINSQKLIGFLVMNIRNNVFDDVIKLQNSSGMCILGNDGTFLAGNEEIGALYDSDYNSEDMVYKDVYLDGEKKTLTGRMAFDSLIVLCVSGKNPESLPQDTIYALMLTLTAFILSALVCGWFITVNIARPIRNLNVAMDRTKSSGWLKKIDEEMPNNEIGRLAESYNSMIEYLNELFKRLLEDEKNVQKAEMRVLQEQIKPHFLYNSLETISYIAVQEKASKVHDALETLGNFYRNFLSKGDREIPLKRELRITQDYLVLQKLRYGDIFEDEYVIDDSTLDCMIPKLILQPLVENSIYHGVRLKGEKCVIRITTYMKDGDLHIIVYDSGIGMDEEQMKNVLEATTKETGETTLSGFGLRGTINRIRYYCDCENVVQIHSEEGEYTEIELIIPMIRETKIKGEE